MLLSRTVYSLTREMRLTGCELHIQTLTFLIVLTLTQCVNAKTVMTIIDNLSRLTRPQPQLTLEVFPRKRVNLEPESIFYPWSAVFSLHFIPSLQSAVCSLQFAVCSLQSAFYTNWLFNFLVKFYGSAQRILTECGISISLSNNCKPLQ